MSKSKISVVTGASGGIGSAIGEALLKRGDKVIFTDIHFSQKSFFKKLQNEFSGRIFLEELDVSCSIKVNEFVKQLLKKFGSVDCLINTAGVPKNGPFYKLSDTDWDMTMAVNLKGAFILSRAFAESMIKRGWGRIVHIGSTASHTATAGNAIYAASKHGMLGLVRGMACDLASFGITVNILCPGNTETKLLQSVLSERAERMGRTLEDIKDEINRKTPIGRIGQPKDISGAAVFLTSDEAGFITGQSLIVDGGRSLNLV